MTNKSMLNDLAATVAVSADDRKGAKKAVRSARNMAVMLMSGASAILALSVAPMAHASMDGEPSATAFRIAASTLDCPGADGCVYTYKSSSGAWPAIVVLGSNAAVPDDVVATFSIVNGVPSYTTLPGQGKDVPSVTYPAIDCATQQRCTVTLRQ